MKKKKRHSLAIKALRDILIDDDQKLKKKGDENGNGLCWLERKKKVPGKFYLIYLGLIMRTFNGKCTGGMNNECALSKKYIYKLMTEISRKKG